MNSSVGTQELLDSMCKMALGVLDLKTLNIITQDIICFFFFNELTTNGNDYAMKELKMIDRDDMQNSMGC